MAFSIYTNGKHTGHLQLIVGKPWSEQGAPETLMINSLLALINQIG